MTSRPLRVATPARAGGPTSCRCGAALGQTEIVACFARSSDKRAALAAKYVCRAAASYDEMLADPSIDAIVNTIPNNVYFETTRQAAEAGKHTFLDTPIANTVADGRRAILR